MLTRYEREMLFIAAMKEGVEEFCKRVGLRERDFWKLVKTGVGVAETMVRENWHDILKVLECRGDKK